MSLAINVADAVTSELNNTGGTVFSQPFTAQRMVLPEFELSDLADLKVAVVPKGVQITGASRAASQYEIAVDIGIQKKLGKDLDTEVSALATLVDEIAEYLCRRPLSQAPLVAWVAIANEPVYAPQHLAEQRVFTSVLTLNYRVLR